MPYYKSIDEENAKESAQTASHKTDYKEISSITDDDLACSIKTSAMIGYSPKHIMINR